jgi:release factor glutamine methyltransferase
MMRGEIFDWIAFNPPYLPSEGKVYDPSWSGGEKGREVICRFLLEAAEHLREDGSIIAIISSNTGIEFEKIEEYYNVELLEEYPLFFEKLYCLLLSPSVTQDKSHL